MTLFLVMSFGAALIWLAVIAVVCFAMRSQRHVVTEPVASRLILWGGAIVPSAVIVAVLSYAMWLMPSLRPFAAAGEAALRIEVTGRQYWWSVTYHHANTPAVSANEIRLPAGRRVELALKSDDVIHSFWIPALGGKMDMIPGRTNRLSLLAQKTGVFRGVCAEYCGTSHTLMALTVVVMEPSAFETWLAAEAKPSPGVGGEGEALFLRHGCGACHHVKGTQASGLLGPDLSHFGARQRLAADIAANTEANIARFIAAPDAFKPGVEMPGFAMLPAQDIRAIAAWLKGLR